VAKVIHTICCGIILLIKFKYLGRIYTGQGKQHLLTEATRMVDVVRISKDGHLLEIKEVSDKYRDEPYLWDEE